MLKDKWIYTELAKINDTALQKNSLQFWPKKKKMQVLNVSQISF